MTSGIEVENIIHKWPEIYKIEGASSRQPKREILNTSQTVLRFLIDLNFWRPSEKFVIYGIYRRQFLSWVNHYVHNSLPN